MYQRLTIIGNLGRNPEMKFLPSGTPVTTLSVATNRTYKDNNGQQVKQTTWFRVSVFGKQAEACAEYLQKGRLVLCEGHLQPDKNTGGPRIWEKQDGTPAASCSMSPCPNGSLTKKPLSPKSKKLNKLIMQRTVHTGSASCAS
jgi:single-strand DNA-binding protein